MVCQNPECGKFFLPKNGHKTKYHSTRCRTRAWELQHRLTINEAKREAYEARKHMNVPRGVKLELIEDPSDTWIVGHRFGSGQVRHDMSVDGSIWPAGIKFRTSGGTVIEVRQCNLWANGREWRGDLK